ncbi:MAG: amidohydrolase family protein [Candidatus Sigynarchaeota archaeon]
MTTVAMPDPAALDIEIHDFHRHVEIADAGDMKVYHVTSACILPSWREYRASACDAYPSNDFTNIFWYKADVKTIRQKFAGWAGQLFTFIPVDFQGGVDKFKRDLDELDPAGVKLHPLQCFPLDKGFLDPFFRIIRDRDLLVHVHTDWPSRTEFGKFKPVLGATFGKLARWYTDITFIMGHAGNNDSYLNIWKIVKRCPNCIVETSMAPTPAELDRVIARVGADRIVFGSNFPYCNTAVEITRVLALHRASAEDKRGILGENARTILKDKPRVVVP